MIQILTGIVAGIISGIGMGGGTILILILSVFSNMDQHITQAINLIFFIPTAMAAIIINIKQKLIDLKLACWIGGFGIIGAIIGASLANKVNSQNLRKYFGIFLAFIAIHEIYSYRKKYKKEKK